MTTANERLTKRQMKIVRYILTSYDKEHCICSMSCDCSFCEAKIRRRYPSIPCGYCTIGWDEIKETARCNKPDRIEIEKLAESYAMEVLVNDLNISTNT